MCKKIRARLLTVCELEVIIIIRRRKILSKNNNLPRPVSWAGKPNYWQLVFGCEPKVLCIQCNVT
jgi:hypothetical protein